MNRRVAIRPRRMRVALAAGAMLLALSACETNAPWEQRPAVAPPDRDDASLLFVSLDTFRGDAAGSAGNPLGRTPWLDRLARQGWALRGLASTPLTLPSHSSMMTGLNPPDHGVRDNGTFRLPAELPTLAEALAAEGVRTEAFVSAFPLDRRFGLARGFGLYDDEVQSAGAGSMLMAQRSGAEVVAAARTAWEAHPTDRRFTWLHFFDAHTPHDAPRHFLNAARRDEYQADVAWADRWLGETVRRAEATLEDYWIVVLGDHGESRGDHQEATHGVFIYGATTTVPAVIWPAPRGAFPGYRAPFRLIDLPATVFDLLGLSPGDAPGRGQSVLRRPGDAGYDPVAYMESRYAHYHYGWAPLAAVESEGWKYIEAPEPELYDLAEDPGETDNVIDTDPDRAADLAVALARLAEHAREATTGALDDDARAALESLGYVTSQSETRDDLPDPKRVVFVQRTMERAQAALSAGDFDSVFAALRRALSFDPQNKDVHLTYGIAYSAVGEHEAAAKSFRRSLELPPHRNDRVPRFELASALLRLDRPDEAIDELKIILATEPDDADAWYNLGVAYQRLNRPQDASRAFESALRADPEHERALELLGRRSR